jgi:hypothetical protein
MHEGIEAIMQQRAQFKTEMRKRKAKPPKLDAKFRSKIANYLVSKQMNEEPSSHQVAAKAAELINAIVSSDEKNVFAINVILENHINVYRR